MTRIAYDIRINAMDGSERRSPLTPGVHSLTIAACLFLLAGCERQLKTFSGTLTEHFSKPLSVWNGRHFGTGGWLSFVLYRGGTFIIDGSGVARQRSQSYQDVAIIRSSALPRTYKLSLVVGHIDYELAAVEGLDVDPQYDESPKEENGCYLLAITDKEPSQHHTNDWWHRHRKIVIDVDNNAWGSGMPHPIFMVYFDTNNDLVSWNGETWQREWRKAVEYQLDAWYTVEVERTQANVTLSVYDESGHLLKRGAVDAKNVWHADDAHPEYLVVGDPHENYYQGSMQIRSITLVAPYSSP